MRIKWIFFALAILTIVAILSGKYGYVQRQTNTLPKADAVLIDAGHGGMDGGASAADGTLEKDINLAIALDLKDILVLFGLPVDMVRETDVALFDDGCSTVREKKVSDMINRLARYNNAKMTVSIHQNHFSVSKYSGAQVFYSPGHPMNHQLAMAIREKIVTLMQPNNTRELKQVTDSVFLLHKTSKPAVLVECGFLSNPQENEALKNAVYQQQMAVTIAAGVLDVYSVEE